MRLNIIYIISRTFISGAFKNKAASWIVLLLGLMLLAATCLGWLNFKQQQEIRVNYQQEIRKQWLNNPDKHPHRMAHYGYFAFRPKHPLSFFDFGMESYTGVSVFLEAHKQNTVNFSEASLSTGILRFGEMSIAMLLQLLVPLLLLFLGYSTVSALREDGTLKIVLCQGVSWQELILGKSLGILSIVMLLFLPVITITAVILWNLGETSFDGDISLRYLMLLASYLIYFIFWSILTVFISSISRTSKSALTILTGIWLTTMIVLPRGAQALGAFRYPTPSKAAFEKALEEDLKKDGDRHNPNDPHFAALKDSLLKTYKVDSVSQLPFNYAGYLMYEGEKISSGVYKRHRKALLELYESQNRFNRYTAFINPYIAIKNLSMALAGTDYASYMDFQDQAEMFRYNLAQRMNKLQIDHISNKKQGDQDKPYSISRKNWEQMPDFNYGLKKISLVLRKEALSITALLLWLALPFVLLFNLARTFKTI